MTILKLKRRESDGVSYLSETMKNLQIINELPNDVTEISVSGNLMGAVTLSGELYMCGAESLNKVCVGLKTQKQSEGYVGLENVITKLVWDLESNVVQESQQKFSNSAFGLFANLALSESIESVTRIACGSTHSVAFTDQNKVYVWGENKSKQIPLASLSGFTELKEGSSLRICGKLGDLEEEQTFPKQVKLFSKGEEEEEEKFKLISVSCGDSHTAVLTSEGLWTCGANESGALGRSGASAPFALVKFGNGKEIVKVACGGFHTAAICSDRELFVWGSNLKGQLGLGQDKVIVGAPKLVQQVKAKDISCIISLKLYSPSILFEPLFIFKYQRWKVSHGSHYQHLQAHHFWRQQIRTMWKWKQDRDSV